MMKITINPQKKTKPLGDLFGIFFEDLNHAADGGLYAEMVRNRSFEFCAMDNPQYHALTAWEASAQVQVDTICPCFTENPHTLRLLARTAGEGICNTGFGDGMAFENSEPYALVFWARCDQPISLQFALEADDHTLASETFTINGDWRKYESTLTAAETGYRGKLSITAQSAGDVRLDFISLMPKNGFADWPAYFRKDIAAALYDMKPKFLRFPGGCLVHDGTLNPDDHDGMYRWKNTVGAVEHRTSRRNSWGYNQTFGLGFYEFFELSELLGAEAIPVVPGGCDPHHRRFATGEVLQRFIDDALDLIEFANGDTDSVWGALRARMGHPAPFNLRYIAIGNEEVHQEFFDRLPLFVQAIRSKYPDIQIIGTAGPHPAGSEFERGWKSARETKVDFVDEHYYQAPEWYYAHAHRYDAYKADEPKVFLGEYASWGNAYENALAEAMYMVCLQNPPSVGLACYAPMLCHMDYINWKPDMIWFNQHTLMKTPNYHAQRLFMRYQGTHNVAFSCEGIHREMDPSPMPIRGELALEANDSSLDVTELILSDGATELRLPDLKLSKHLSVPLGNTTDDFCLSCSVQRTSGMKGMNIIFGKQGNESFIWGFGGWENQDSILNKQVRGRNSNLTQTQFSIEDGHKYCLQLRVQGRRIQTLIDGKVVNETEDLLPVYEPLYVTASGLEEQIIIKVVNPNPVSQEALVTLDGHDCSWHSRMETISGHDLNRENTIGDADVFEPKMFFKNHGKTATYGFDPYSINVILLQKM